MSSHFKKNTTRYKTGKAAAKNKNAETNKKPPQTNSTLW